MIIPNKSPDWSCPTAKALHGELKSLVDGAFVRSRISNGGEH